MPAKPWENGTTESFKGRFRDGCLRLEWFRSRAEAKAVIEPWQRAFEPGLSHVGRFAASLRSRDAAPARGAVQGRLSRSGSGTGAFEQTFGSK
ncbi:MAG: transposase [Hyphomicrobiaceae bacterium]|nr:transposase [Hyphomicrobiaceae bacterium]